MPRGKTIALTPMRRLMCDMLHFSKKIPLVAIERRLALADVIEARQTRQQRPSWFALFIKAFALVGERREVLRRSYLSFPWARLYQHSCNVAQLAVARKIGAEEAVLCVQIRSPERMSLDAIDERIRRARTEPIESLGDFRRLLRLARFPGPLRRLAWWIGLNTSGSLRAQNVGTFGVTAVSALGSSSLHVLAPLTSTLTYGVIEKDGSVMLRLFYDHRVMDGVEPAAALADLEEALRGPIADELRGHVRCAA